MLRQVRAENADSLVERAVVKGMDERAEFVHFELKQHYLLIRLRWGSRMRMLWRGPRREGQELMAYLKAAAGMEASASRVPQSGQFAFHYEGQDMRLPAVCKPYLSEEKVVLSLQRPATGG